MEICLKRGQSMICEQSLTLAASWPGYPPHLSREAGRARAPAETGQKGLKTGKKQENRSIFLSELNALWRKCVII